MNDNLRLFFAIDLTDKEVRESVSAYIDYLRSFASKGSDKSARARWTKPENLHLTVKFLGAVERTRLSSLHQAADRAVSQIEPFSFTISGAGAFPSAKNARVLWLGVKEPHGWLALLHRQLEAACAEIGFNVEERPFHPHLTIARLPVSRIIAAADAARNLAAAHLTADFAARTVHAHDLHLMESVMPTAHDSRGVIYRTLERFSFTTRKPEALQDANSK